MTLSFHEEAAGFLAEAGDHLALDPIVNTVVTSVAMRERGHGRPESDAPHWYLIVRDSWGRVVGAGMRTAPFAPYPAFLLPMPAPAAVELARVVHDRGEVLGGVNGALPAVRLCAEEFARLAGRDVSVQYHTRLHRLDQLFPPDRAAPGRLRPATDDDLSLVQEWFDAFMDDADEQAGRPRGSSAHESPSEPELRRRIRTGRVFLWEDGGVPVHLTAATPSIFGAARLGPVYTPPQHRGQGYAAAAVAAVTRLILDEGAVPCLFTDQANPVSNQLYARLGYRPVVDMANLVVG